MQLNITLVVGVSSFIESCGQGVGSIRLMWKSDIVLLGKGKKEQNNLMIVQLQNISLIWIFFLGGGVVHWAKLSPISLCFQKTCLLLGLQEKRSLIDLFPANKHPYGEAQGRRVRSLR